jgi:hypothetical protein
MKCRLVKGNLFWDGRAWTKKEDDARIYSEPSFAARDRENAMSRRERYFVSIEVWREPQMIEGRWAKIESW